VPAEGGLDGKGDQSNAVLRSVAQRLLGARVALPGAAWPLRGSSIAILLYQSYLHGPCVANHARRVLFSGVTSE